ncbi:MAG: hypothetical protein AAF430_19600 [Myxococcota bacterium]
MRTSLLLLVSVLAAIAHPLPAVAGRTGQVRAECQIFGQPAVLALQYEAIASHGITVGPGANPDITGVIPDGTSTVYWSGTLRTVQGTVPISGENTYLRFYDRNVLNRETVLEVTLTGPRTFTLQDVFGNYPGIHPCTIVSQQ